MPVDPTHPGVFVEEARSGVRPVAGVPTAVTAFVGPARKGPTDEPVSCLDFGDFQRVFGGLWERSPMSYAVDDFFTNGGTHAIIVRLHKGDGGPGQATFTVDNLELVAANPGKWAEELRVITSHPEDAIAAAGVADSLGLHATDLFDLEVMDKSSGTRLESFRNVTAHQDGGARRVDRVLDTESELVCVNLDSNGNPVLAGARPADNASSDGQGGSDGADLTDNDYIGDEANNKGIYALLRTDIFNLLCIPPPKFDEIPTSSAVWAKAASLCRRCRAFLLVDSPPDWDTKTVAQIEQALPLFNLSAASANAALYYPRIRKPDLLRDGQLGTFVPCGAIAGVMARTDSNRGVWKAAAGREAGLAGVQELGVELNSQENGVLNPVAVNCLRTFPVIGRVIWGARTLRGADLLADEYKYVPVRRLALFIEESLYRGTRWAVFEPNDEPLWSQIRLTVGEFMQRLFQQGAFQGQSARAAYVVKCDRETMSQSDIDSGIVNIIIGFAPLKPAEFLIIKVQQILNSS
jgi:phage tail sheath protein FI